MSFLKAEWRKLAFINYAIDKAFLQDYVPYGTELDLWEGKCYVSLIGFRFINTRLLGIRIPFHTDFEEVNLRFYVKRLVGAEWRRGVVFIKEMVPKPALTFVANTVYREKYETLPMQHAWHENEETRTVEYKWRKKKQWQSLKVTAGKKAIPIEAGSESAFITEHYWGYAPVTATKSNQYEVTHPQWLQYPVSNTELSVDFELTYGPTFEFLNNCQPASVMLAEGSEITIENKQLIQ